MSKVELKQQFYLKPRSLQRVRDLSSTDFHPVQPSTPIVFSSGLFGSVLNALLGEADAGPQLSALMCLGTG